MPNLPVISIPVTPGELLDRITSLSLQRKVDRRRKAEIASELKSLEEIREQRIGYLEELLPLESELFAVNSAIQVTEDGLRRCEEKDDFGKRFIDLVLKARQHSERRLTLIREIDLMIDENWSHSRPFAA